MRIGIDARTFFQKTGVGRTTRHLLSKVAAMDPENEYVVFISNHHREEDYPFISPNTKVVVSRAEWMGGRDELSELAREATSHRLDLMYFLFQLPEKFPVPFAIKVYDIIPLLFPEWHIAPVVDMFRDRLGASCAEAGVIITPSYATARDLCAAVSGVDSRLHVVPEAVALKAGNNSQLLRSSQSGSPFALFVGTLEPRKNVRFLIQLWKHHGAELNGMQLVIAGKAGWDDVACGMAKAGIPGVHYLGYVSDDELAELYSSACCLAYPSLYEGFGLPIIEAMAAGCPVVTSHCGSLGEVAGNAAIVLDPHEGKDWVDALNRMRSNPAARRSLSEKGRVRASEFTLERHVRGTLQVLHHILAEACA